MWRSPDYVFSRLFIHVFVSLFISLPFLQLGNSLRDLQYRLFGMYVRFISDFACDHGSQSFVQLLDCYSTHDRHVTGAAIVDSC